MSAFRATAHVLKITGALYREMTLSALELLPRRPARLRAVARQPARAAA